ncbi:hypothetical protein O181_115436 [Austropuccinia psidii MF-1]|uniref:Uncharacterized protein n=1 Tax=Austropuccinia psidii MF-1 TaxID=1389203 RepID=A0A9Q3PW71_9BASI|nr:hypothetical protein [Austropuccinia psidii MF-1]
MEGDEVYAYWPLVHKEKVTGRHNPYASKPRMGHANSSRGKVMDDEDENISPTQIETNSEPSIDNFTMHVEGTQENSEFTQSMLNQSEMRQQRNQACKAHNVEKCSSQKEQHRLLKISMGLDQWYMSIVCSYLK